MEQFFAEYAPQSLKPKFKMKKTKIVKKKREGKQTGIQRLMDDNPTDTQSDTPSSIDDLTDASEDSGSEDYQFNPVFYY